MFSEKFHDIPGSEQSHEFLDNWRWFREFRSQILKEIEIKREKGLIGSSLEAEVLIETGPSTGTKLLSLEVDLKTLFITSDVVLNIQKIDEFKSIVKINKSQHHKCERCWHRCSSVPNTDSSPSLCSRCKPLVDIPPT